MLRPPTSHKVELTEKFLLMVYEIKLIAFTYDTRQLITDAVMPLINKGVSLNSNRLGLDLAASGKIKQYLRNAFY